MPKFGSQIDADGIPIVNVGYPENPGDVATKGYVDGPFLSDGSTLRDALAQANQDIEDAVAAAESKNSVTNSSTAPGGAATGDIWVNSADGNSIHIFDGSNWTAAQLGTDAIAPFAIAAKNMQSTTHLIY